jgi:hypothetical protein
LLKKISFFLILLATSCSSGPAPKTDHTAPAWTLQPARTSDGARLAYVGVGEDRDPQNALTKAQAIALQDLENDCSLIPKGTQLQPERYDETVGILTRSFALFTISLQECLAARGSLSTLQIRDISNSEFTAQVDHYQKTYDAPEPEEAVPLGTSAGAIVIADSPHLFIVRQQVALTKQKMLLAPNDFAGEPKPIQELPHATQAIAAFEQTDPKIWSDSRAFSTGRPNAIAHQASAVRDTIQERARIQQAYPVMPPPLTPAKTGNSKGSGGRGSRHRGQQPPPTSSDQSNGSSGN